MEAYILRLVTRIIDRRRMLEELVRPLRCDGLNIPILFFFHQNRHTNFFYFHATHILYVYYFILRDSYLVVRYKKNIICVA